MVKILVIDDSSFISRTIKKILEPKGFEIIDNAFNGEEGIELYKNTSPDIVVLDYVMPVMDGLETAKQLLEIDPGAKIIMLSASNDKFVIEDARKYGVKEFLLKPFKRDEFYAVINRLLEE